MTYRDCDRRRQDLKDAVSGVALTERDEALLDWMAGCWDQDTTTALADLVWRSRAALAGPISAGALGVAIEALITRAERIEAQA